MSELELIEASFDCTLPVNYEDSIKTFGDLHDYVVSTLGFSSGGSVGMHVFNTVRRALVEGSGLRRTDVKPDSNLDELMPLKIRRSMWSGFLRTLPWNTENLYLRYPKHVSKPASIAAVVCFVAIWVVGGIIAAMQVFNILYMVPVLIFTAATVYFLWSEPKNPLATEIPEIFNTPRKLTRYLVRTNYGKIAKDTHMWNETEAWALIQEIMTSQPWQADREIRRDTALADMIVDS